MTRTKYQQLQHEERMRIEIWKAENINQREMARRLGRAPSTLMHELRRNATATGSYKAMTAQARRGQRRQAGRAAPKLSEHTVLWGVVRHFLQQKWSPQEISATLKRAFPDQSDLNVSHETIYNAIYAYPRGELRRQLIVCLRQGHAKRLPRSRGTDRRGQIPDMVSIHVRPPEVNDRLMPGHWEGDLIKGAGNRSAVGVLVERMSRAVLLVKMSDATAASASALALALAGFTAKLQSLVEPLRQTLTYDQVARWPGTPN